MAVHGRPAEAHRLRSAWRGMSRPDQDEEDSWDDSEGSEETALEPPTAGALVRLLQFARPRAGLIALGFVLTLGATAAGLVPPHLTGLLVDQVLTPYQNQVANVGDSNLPEPIKLQQLAELKTSSRDQLMMVGWYLGGIAAAAVLTWLFTWGQGIVMAFASERISADLRIILMLTCSVCRLSILAAGGLATCCRGSAPTPSESAIFCPTTWWIF